MPSVPAFLSARTMRWLNVAAVLWAALWIGLAAYTAYEVNALRTLSNTVVKAGVATESAGEALETIGGIPLVGGRIGTLGRQAADAGRSAQVSGASSRSTIDRLAILFGIAIGLIPTVPLLVLYVPLQMTWRRDRRAVARRALAHLPYHELRELALDGDAAFESRDRLAAAELRRLGLDRPARRLLDVSRLRGRVGR